MRPVFFLILWDTVNIWGVIDSAVTDTHAAMIMLSITYMERRHSYLDNDVTSRYLVHKRWVVEALIELRNSGHSAFSCYRSRSTPGTNRRALV
jgi:hypothetical protein